MLPIHIDACDPWTRDTVSTLRQELAARRAAVVEHEAAMQEPNGTIIECRKLVDAITNWLGDLDADAAGHPLYPDQ